jgi:hypothetical protein
VIEKVYALENGDVFIPCKIAGIACKIHSCPPRLLSLIKDDLDCFVFKVRQQGIQVSIHMICQEACHLLPNFRSKSIVAKNSAILCFITRIRLTYHAATHTAQKHFQETKEESKHFIEFMKTKLVGKNPCDIIPFHTLSTQIRLLKTRG